MKNLLLIEFSLLILCLIIVNSESKIDKRDVHRIILRDPDPKPKRPRSSRHRHRSKELESLEDDYDQNSYENKYYKSKRHQEDLSGEDNLRRKRQRKRHNEQKKKQTQIYSPPVNFEGQQDFVPIYGLHLPTNYEVFEAPSEDSQPSFETFDWQSAKKPTKRTRQSGTRKKTKY